MNKHFIQPKITIIGAGQVGGQVAFCVTLLRLGDVVLIDNKKELAQGKAMDISHALSGIGSDNKIIGSNKYSLTKESDIVVITAGIGRKEKMSRDDLLTTNAKIIQSIVPKAIKLSPKSIVIIVTNPVDAMAQLAYGLGNIPRKRILGFGGFLDTCRYRTLLAMKIKRSPGDIKALIIGSHSDLMIPIIKESKVNNKNINQFISCKKHKQIIKQTQYAGSAIISLLKTNAFFAPGLLIAQTIKIILHNEKKILPCSVLLQGEYGINDLFVSVPVILDRKGIEKIVEEKLSSLEQRQLSRTAVYLNDLNQQVNECLRQEKK